MTTLTATTALLLDLLCLAAAFGWRTLTHWRATGSTGYLGVAGRPGSLPWWGGALFVLAILMTLEAPVLAIAEVVVPPAGWPHPVLAAAGLVVALAGIALALVAQHEMGVAWRIGVDASERTALVTTGVFAHVRNPFFTAMVTVATGLVALVPTGISALAVVCLIAAVQIQVRVVEEPYLATTHGLAYGSYAARAGRFLPHLGRLAAPSSTRDLPDDGARPC
jgi:protein-S-isoprenylcysteine O-methyltransferase Ste14